jgi:serine/threonine protein kinase
MNLPLGRPHCIVVIDNTVEVWLPRHTPLDKTFAFLAQGSDVSIDHAIVSGKRQSGLKYIADIANGMSEPSCHPYTLTLLVGLLQLHHHGIVHADIRPENTVWDAEAKKYKLIDLGQAVLNEGR